MNLIDSLTNTTALKLSQQAQLPDPAFMSLMAIQKTLTLEQAATSPTFTKLIKYHGERTTTKLVCAVLKLFNDSLNTTLQMSARQLFECAELFAQTYPNESLKDLVLCLKRAKMGLYGEIFNRIDTTVIAKFFREYLAEKADWWEQRQLIIKRAHQQATTGELGGLDSVLTDEQRNQLKALTARRVGSGLLQRAINEQTQLDQTHVKLITSRTGRKRATDSGAYMKWLATNVHLLDEATLLELEQSSTQQEDLAVLDIVQREIKHRLNPGS